MAEDSKEGVGSAVILIGVMVAMLGVELTDLWIFFVFFWGFVIAAALQVFVMVVRYINIIMHKIRTRHDNE